MSAYLIANLDVIDPVAFAGYRDLVAPLIARFGGRYLVRGGAITDVEGSLGLKRTVILEFDTMDALKAFYHSPEYAPLIAMRTKAATSHVSLLEGYAP